MNQDIAVRGPGGLADPGGQGSEDIVTYAKWVVESGLFGRGITQAQAGLKMLVGRELGIQPLAAVRNIYIFEAQGRPVVILDATLMGAMVRTSGRYDYDVEQHDDTTTVMAMYRLGPNGARTFLGRESFSNADAAARKLANKPGPWSEGYKPEMRFARCMSRLVDHYAPELLLGLSVPVVTQDDADEMPMGHDQRKAIFAGLKPYDMSDDERHDWASDILGRRVDSFAETHPTCPSRLEAKALLRRLEEMAGGEWTVAAPDVAEGEIIAAGEAERAEPREEGGTGSSKTASVNWADAPREMHAKVTGDWATPSEAQDVAAGAGGTGLGEVPQPPAPAATHVVQTLMDESDSMAEYRDVREQIKLRKRNAAAIATTREFLIGQGDAYKGITPEAGIKLLDEAGILEQLTAKLIERHLS
jgi:hypothetical protein